MSAIHTFTANLAHAGKRFDKIKSTVEGLSQASACLNRKFISLLSR